MCVQVKDTFRFHPAVAHGLGRVVGRGGVKIGDHTFQEGVCSTKCSCISGRLSNMLQVHLSVNPWVIHRSTEFFGTDAKTFNPDRWLGRHAKGMDRYMMQVIPTVLIRGHPYTDGIAVRCWIQLLSRPKSGPNGNL